MPQTPEIEANALIATLVAQAERETDPKVRADLLATADHLRDTIRKARTKVAEVEGLIDQSRALRERLERSRRVPLWMAALVIAALVAVIFYGFSRQL
jgi:type VI protein secretion system component VasF